MQRNQLLSALFLAVTLALFGSLHVQSSQRLLAVARVGGPVRPAASEAQGLQPLTQGQVLDGFAAWSPDGRRVAFMRGGQLMELTLAGGEPQALTSPSPTGWDVNVSYAPDGQSLLFIRQPVGEGEYQLMRLTPGAKEPQALLTSRLPLGYAAFAPDGKGIAFSSSRGLYHLDLATGQVIPLYEESGRRFLEGGLAWHPSGEGLVVGVGPNEVSEPFDLWWLPASGAAAPAPPGSTPVSGPGELRRLTQEGGIMPAFAADGQTVYYRRPKQESGIWRLDLATLATEPVLADSKTHLYFHPAPSPAGSRLIVSRLSVGSDPLTSALYQLSIGP